MNEVLERLARGVVMAGFQGTHPPAELHGLAGYVLFARNGTAVDDVRRLAEALRAREGDHLVPLIAIDQEGGRVSRLQEGVEAMPSAMAFGAAGDAELARRAGEQVAFDLRRAGCSFDLAPVLDLALQPDDTAIGTRSFGSDPQRVARLGGAFAAGLAAGGAIACYKHFPGHGSTATDSHLALPVVEASAAVLRERDLAPFAALVREARAVMGAHVLYPAFDAAQPATRSRSIVELLRGEFGFGGVYVTDCLQMGGAGAQTADAALASLAAGADLLLVSRGDEIAREIVDRLARAVEAGELAFERLREAHDRVRTLRAASLEPLDLEATAPHPGVGREAARRAVTLIRGIPYVDPTSAIAVSFEAATNEGAAGEHRLHLSLCAQAPALEQIELPLEPDAMQVDRALETLRSSSRRALVLARRAHRYAGQAAAIDRLLAVNPDAIVVSLREPYDLPLFGRANHLLATYGDDAAAIGGLADVLFGGSAPQGALPVAVAGL